MQFTMKTLWLNNKVDYTISLKYPSTHNEFKTPFQTAWFQSLGKQERGNLDKFLIAVGTRNIFHFKIRSIQGKKIAVVQVFIQSTAIWAYNHIS